MTAVSKQGEMKVAGGVEELVEQDGASSAVCAFEFRPILDELYEEWGCSQSL